jgi:hypothetical protein
MWMATRDTNVTVRDVLAVVAFPTLATVAVGLALAAVTAQLTVVAGLVAIAAAGVVYALVAAAAVWRLPVYSRVRARAVALLDRLRAFVSPGLEKG